MESGSLNYYISGLITASDANYVEIEMLLSLFFLVGRRTHSFSDYFRNPNMGTADQLLRLFACNPLIEK